MRTHSAALRAGSNEANPFDFAQGHPGNDGGIKGKEKLGTVMARCLQGQKWLGRKAAGGPVWKAPARLAELAFARGFQQLAQTSRSRVAIKFARGDIENELFPLVRWQCFIRQQIVAL